MKIKNNKGYVGVDVSISIIILLIIIPTLTGMIYNVTKTKNDISRKSEAINIAINSIEAVKGLNIDEATNENAIDKIKEIYSELDEEQLTIIRNDNTYKIEIQIQDYGDTDEGKAKGAEKGIVKIAKVIVTYKSGSVDLSTVIS